LRTLTGPWKVILVATSINAKSSVTIDRVVNVTGIEGIETLPEKPKAGTIYNVTVASEPE
jgi:hypothetical protein